jgi:hypothetical protein
VLTSRVTGVYRLQQYKGESVPADEDGCITLFESTTNTLASSRLTGNKETDRCLTTPLIGSQKSPSSIAG